MSEKLHDALESKLMRAISNNPACNDDVHLALETCLEFLSALEKIEGDPPIFGEDSREDFVAMIKSDVKIAREAITKAERRMMGDGK